jgi:multimeric flavodoxin WrbA
MSLSAIALNCTLKRSGSETSSTDKMIALIESELSKRGVDVRTTIRIADHDIKPGVTSDEGDGDEWPQIRKQILNCDILVFGTPIWMGQMSSLAKRVIERMDAFLSETDAQGRMPSFGKLAVVGVVGNEDGAHHVAATLFQALNDVGWTLAAGASDYWVGEAMQKVDFKDLPRVPEAVSRDAAMLAANAVHLATMLKANPFPGIPEAK